MSGISSRLGNVAFAKQSAKGVTAGAPAKRFFLAAAPSLMPVKNRARFAMTDDNRDQGNAYTSSMNVAGEVTVYAHYDGLANLLYYAMGANVDAGAGPYTHTITGAADVPWITVWYTRGAATAAAGGVIEKYVDCKVTSLRIEGSAGSPLMVTLGLLGITSNYEASEPALAALTSSPAIYPEFLGELKVATVAQKLHRLSFAVEQNLAGYQADDFFLHDIDPGGRQYSLAFATRHTGPTAFPDYKTFFYGGGTTLVPAVATSAFAAKAVRSAGLSVQLDIAAISYAAIPVHADPGGAPIEVEVACEVERPPSGEIVQFTVTDSNTTVT